MEYTRPLFTIKKDYIVEESNIVSEMVFCDLDIVGMGETG